MGWKKFPDGRGGWGRRGGSRKRSPAIRSWGKGNFLSDIPDSCNAERKGIRSKEKVGGEKGKDDWPGESRGILETDEEWWGEKESQEGVDLLIRSKTGRKK